MRAELPKREPVWLEQWESVHLYQSLRDRQVGRPEFILHDGPPFANGDAHMGHALNMALKDIVLKSKNMSGFSVPFIPGWDCHGLPIEHKVMKELNEPGADSAKNAAGLDPVIIREKCAAMAEKYISIQREQFKRLGVFGLWDDPYITMQPSYEADVLRVFGKMVEKGLVFQALKPVHWSTGCQTALAEAEVEYLDRHDTSVYVACPLDPQGLKRLERDQASLVIWTTTPWTLPANLAIACHRKLEYVLVENGGTSLILAAERLEVFHQITGKNWKVLKTIKGDVLEGLEYVHPFLKDGKTRQVFHGDFVTAESGSGLVHIAPGHGNDDYLLGMREGLEVLSPVDDRGCLTGECGVPELVGQYVFKANKQIEAILEECGHLLASEDYDHSYPHCWRSKTPIVFRSVTQWFIRVEDFRPQALAEIETVNWVPEWGKNRIRGAVETRPDWCISRQRTWGIPIPAFVNEEGEAVLSAKTVYAFADLVETEGTDLWFRSSSQELAEKLGLPRNWEKTTDTLDVWIDSGSSHEAVSQRRLRFPADLYLEGSDQHRGWFQSSLLTSVAVNGKAPYREVLTNGFVVDEDRKKLSKSSGKPVGLMEFVNQYGSDILRLWVSSEDYRNEVPFSEEIFKRVADTYRSLRNTCRILLANLQDFDPENDRVAVGELRGADYGVHCQVQQLIRKVRSAYEAYEFHQVYHLVNRFCAVELSALYIDVTKDRMYCDPAASSRRRATQTVMADVLNSLCLLMAPIMPFTCEEVWQYAGAGEQDNPEGILLRDSVHLQPFPEPQVPENADAFLAQWEQLLTIRGQVNDCLEQLRRDKKIGKSLEAVVSLPESLPLNLSDEEWAEICIVSAVERSGQAGMVSARPAAEAGWEKCPRCWSFHPADRLGQHVDHPECCPRCTEAMTASA